MKKLFTILIVLFVASSVYSQHNSLYTLFMWNKLNYNPAYAGSKEALTLSAHYRHQWQGVEGAPRTFTLNGHTSFAGDRCGIGLSIMTDKIGLLNSNYLKLSYAYRLRFKNQSVLSVGFGLELDYTRFDWNNVQTLDVFDKVVNSEDGSHVNFDFGVGLYYTSRYYYIGISMPQLFKKTLDPSGAIGLGESSDFRPLYLMGGFWVPLGKNVKLKPAFLLTYVPNAPFEMDYNLSALFVDKLWVGLSYRLDDSVSGLVQFQINKMIKMGLAVDYTLSELNDYTKGSFELMFEYSFRKDNKKLENLRFF